MPSPPAGEAVAVLSWMRTRRRKDGVVGVALDSAGVAVAHVVPSAERPRLAACDVKACDDPSRLGDALAGVVRAQGLSGCEAVAVLPPQAYGLWLLDAPDVSRAELSGAVRWIVQDLIDFPIGAAVTDYFEYPNDVTPGQRERVYVVATPAERVQRTLDAAAEADLRVGPIDITELALRNVAERLSDDGRGRALLQLGLRRGLLVLTRGRDLLLARRLEVGLEALRGISARAPSDELELEGQERDALLLEVQRSLDYFESQLGQPPVDELVVAPLEEPTAGLLEFLEKNLVAPVRSFDLSELLDLAEGVPETVQARCLTAVGAALRGELRNP